MKKIITGLLLTATAVLILMSCMNVNLGFIGILPITDILLSVILLSVAVGALIKGHIGFIPFPLAVIFMLIESEIAEYLGMADKNMISNWLLLLCTLLISIGLTMISSPIKKKINNSKYCKRVQLGSETKYIDCNDFDKTISVSCRLGSSEIYFTNIESYKGGQTIDVDCKMGNLEIHIPSAWNLKADVKTSLANTEICEGGTANGPEISVIGNNSMGNVEVSFC